MTRAGISLFLVIHGLLHLGIWLPRPPDRVAVDGTKATPFEPAHSWVKTQTLQRPTSARRLSVQIAGWSAALYCVAAATAVLQLPGAVVVLAIAAAATGILLKALYFHPWLIFGLVLDFGVIVIALEHWP